MNAVQHDFCPPRLAGAPTMLSLPMGLLGFEKAKRFELQPLPDADAFVWLDMADRPGRGFYGAWVNELIASYAPAIATQDLEFLRLKCPADGLLLVLAIRPNDGEFTLFLRAPLLINPQTLVGKQVVPINFNQLPAERRHSVLAVSA